MQPFDFVRQSIRMQDRGTHRSQHQALQPVASDSRKSAFAKKQGNQESRAQTARRSLHAGKLPNGVRWKNLLRR
ncbi:MAG: hypothetical protein DMG77_18710 [Acidobacteria bacterium]|nr:MAG: hypothetical protein DMG77_18710 [Acidobacteriota bacterium]